MKKALLVGINDYPGSGNDLGGCVNDTANLKNLIMKEFGFDAGGVRVLVDARATRAAILGALQDLVAKASAGDTLVFHYSGHGSQVPDEDGDEKSDRLDEVICPRDFSWDGCWISDDDLSDIFSGLAKEVHLEVLLDCCHSGTGTREIALGKGSGALEAGLAGGLRARTARVRFMPRPPGDSAKLGAAFRTSAVMTKIGTLVKAKPRGLNHVLWTACRSDQYSADADIGGSPNGAFTWFFCDAARASAKGSTRAALLDHIRKGLRGEGFDQSPQLECRKSAREGGLFSAG
ncbi:MAG: caspase family protein [Spirochaetes bacterium]|nr:caspase family protein [Spirochaetota bacterium]